MDSYKSDRNLFYKLIRKQRGTNKGLATIDFGDNISKVDGWAN